jgi:hypothetical protein
LETVYIFQQNLLLSPLVMEGLVHWLVHWLVRWRYKVGYKTFIEVEYNSSILIVEVSVHV